MQILLCSSLELGHGLCILGPGQAQGRQPGTMKSTLASGRFGPSRAVGPCLCLKLWHDGCHVKVLFGSTMIWNHSYEYRTIRQTVEALNSVFARSDRLDHRFNTTQIY